MSLSMSAIRQQHRLERLVAEVRGHRAGHLQVHKHAVESARDHEHEDT